MPQLRDPAPDWTAWRHQPQFGCPRCDARHDGGPVHRVLPHHYYVCTRHRYWIGPPDAGQAATELYGPIVGDLTSAQRRHDRLVRRYGSAATFDAVLTGFLICGHIWDEPGHRHGWERVIDTWTSRASWFIPHGSERLEFSASKLFAVAYPEAVRVAELIGSPVWRDRAAGSVEQQQVFLREMSLRLLRREPDTTPAGGDAIAHWMKHDSWRPPSAPSTTFPSTRAHGPISTDAPMAASLERQKRSANWFAVTRRGGSTILHHRHVRPVLIREWSPSMDGINAAIWASASLNPPERTTAFRT